MHLNMGFLEEGNQLAEAQVHLVQSVRILPHQSQEVVVKLEGCSLQSPLLVESTEELQRAAELQAEDTLVLPMADGLARIVLSNTSAFTQTVEGGCVIGEASSVAVESPTAITSAHCGKPDTTMDLMGSGYSEADDAYIAIYHVSSVCTLARDNSGRAERIRSLFADNGAPAEYKEQLLQLLIQQNQVFGLDETERGETDLVQLHIDTGTTPPLRQRARQMPFVARKEVARPLQLMQDTRVIQASASPTVLVRKKDGSHRFCIDYRQ